MRYFSIAAAITIFASLGCSRAANVEAAPAEQTAKAELRDANGRSVGSATLTQTPHGVLIAAHFSNVPPGTHAFHIHAVGQCTPPFTSAGPHFNPTNRQHGIQNPEGMHGGDLPNVVIPESGSAQVDVFARDVTLSQGANAILDSDGAALILHAGVDDYKSDPAGNAGDRIACGVVEK
jgi:Cu-Zn family superoxide dismutase